MSLELRRVGLAIGGRLLLEPMDLAIAGGSAVSLVGASGCGKSSLLALICGTLDRRFATTGEVWSGGGRIDLLPTERRRVGILFQDDLLFPHLSVGQNLAFALPATIRGRSARRERVEQALVEADLAGFHDRDPATLSGGQKRRAAVMRALLAEPMTLLLDEAFSSLDPALRARFRSFVFNHARRAGIPVLQVTHDPEDAAAAGGRVLDPFRPVDGG